MAHNIVPSLVLIFYNMSYILKIINGLQLICMNH
jgi:hypothetical protein